MGKEMWFLVEGKGRVSSEGREGDRETGPILCMAERVGTAPSTSTASLAQASSVLMNLGGRA